MICHFLDNYNSLALHQEMNERYTETAKWDVAAQTCLIKAAGKPWQMTELYEVQEAVGTRV